MTSSPPRLVERFPDPCRATGYAGVVACSATLDHPSVLAAYARGIFPWPEDEDRVYWCSPDPRGVLEPRAFHRSQRLRRRARQLAVDWTVDRAFDQVLDECAAARPGRTSTWITAAYSRVYRQLHAEGRAHSFEAYAQGELIGGVYGLHCGNWFAAESMFSARSDGSKLALWGMCEQLSAEGVDLIDVQLLTPHLASLGAVELPRSQFLRRIGAL